MIITVSITTLGNGADAVIRTISASMIGADEDAFERVIDIDSCLAIGLRVDGRGLTSWKENTEEESIPVPLAEALSDLRDAFCWEEAQVLMDMWQHHAAVLDTAYRRLGQSVPWPFYNLGDIALLPVEQPRMVKTHVNQT